MSQPDASVIEYVNNHRLAVLATQRKAKSAQLTVINYMFNGEDFKVSVRGFSQKAKNILKRPEVSMAIVDGREQVIVYGKADVVSEFDEVVRLHREMRSHAGMPEQPEDEFLERLRSEERVVLVIRPDSFYPETMPQR